MCRSTRYVSLLCGWWATVILFRKRNAAIVARHFQIAYSTQRLRTALAAESYGSFPIVCSESRFPRQFLRFEGSLRFQFDVQFWDGNSPMDWIARARNWACPNFASRLQDEINRTQMRSLSLFVHVRTGGVGIDRTIPASNAKEHQLRIVRKLQTQPVPASLFRVKLVREELMIHPTGAAHLKSLITQFDRTGSYEPC